MRATAFGLESSSVDGQNVRAVHAVAEALVDRARNGNGPAFLLCNTYRYHGHHVGDINREYYRSKQEAQEWKTKRDPIKNFAGWMIQQRVADEMALEEIRKNVRVEMKAAVEFAIAASYPKSEEAEEN